MCIDLTSDGRQYDVVLTLLVIVSYSAASLWTFLIGKLIVQVHLRGSQIPNCVGTRGPGVVEYG